MIAAPAHVSIVPALDCLEPLVIGVDHQAPMALRERLAAAAPSLLDHLAPQVAEAALLSTCNRTELYLVRLPAPAPPSSGSSRGLPLERSPASASSAMPTGRCGLLASMIAQATGLPEDALWLRQGPEAARHLFAVSAGLESQLLGETEILRQVRTAAQSNKSAGPVLRALFRHALTVGKRARARTGISRGAASIGSAAAAIVRAELPQPERRHAVLVGAGDAAARVLAHLRPLGFARVDVVNRTVARAAGLVGQGGGAYGLDALPRLLAEADAVLCATSSPDAVVTLQAAAPAVRNRQGRRLLLLDLAVPRDVESAVADLPSVTLYDLDAVQARATADVARRAAAAGQARALVDDEVDTFGRWLSARRAAPAIARLRGDAEAHRRRRYPADDRASRALMRRLLHAPTIALRRGAEPDLSALTAAGFLP